jgi:hypothetical protein
MTLLEINEYLADYRHCVEIDNKEFMRLVANYGMCIKAGKLARKMENMEKAIEELERMKARLEA